MVVEFLGDSINVHDVEYAVGMWVKATGSLYEGLEGYIKEIRTDTDSLTGEDGAVDLRCCLEYPDDPLIRERIEKRFSILYGAPKVLEELEIEDIVLAADMVYPAHLATRYSISAIGNADPESLQTQLSQLGLSEIKVESSLALDAFLQSLTPNVIPGLADKVCDWIHHWSNGGGDYSTEEMIRSTCRECGDTVSARELARSVYASVAGYCKSAYEALTMIQEIFNETIDEAQRKICESRAVC